MLNDAVMRALRGGAPSVDVVGYSAGGVTALVWARDDDGARKARRIITLGSPFHGTVIAATAQGFAPGACPVACQQLVAGQQPARPAGRRGARPAAVALTMDDRRPDGPAAASARLPGAMNVPIQSVCPRQQISHSQLPTSPVVTAIVLQAIGPGVIRHPELAVCRA